MGSNIEFLRIIDASGVNCSVFTTTSEPYNITGDYLISDNYDIDESIFKQRKILDIIKDSSYSKLHVLPSVDINLNEYIKDIKSGDYILSEDTREIYMLSYIDKNKKSFIKMKPSISDDMKTRIITQMGYTQKIIESANNAIEIINDHYKKQKSLRDVIDPIHQYFKPQYEKLEKEMDEISREYDRKYQELIRKIPKTHSYSGLSTPIEFLFYQSVRRLSDDELIKRVKRNQWISDRDRQRVNDDELILGLYLSIY